MYVHVLYVPVQVCTYRSRTTLPVATVPNPNATLAIRTPLGVIIAMPGCHRYRRLMWRN